MFVGTWNFAIKLIMSIIVCLHCSIMITFGSELNKGSTVTKIVQKVTVIPRPLEQGSYRSYKSQWSVFSYYSDILA